VSQDEVKQDPNQILVGKLRPSAWVNLEMKENTHLTKREKEILTLSGKGMSRSDICKLLDITRENLRFYIKTLNRKFK
jgi:DNA-binding NarL/FixJ family response regulator